MQQYMLPLGFPDAHGPRETKGVVYTKPWVVELLLDLAKYSPAENIVDALAIEPAAGEGAFLVAMARRLIASCLRQGRPLADCEASLIAYELDEPTARAARGAVVGALVGMDVGRELAEKLAGGWVRAGDYLLDAFRLPDADYVIGNPPYVRLEDIPAGTASLYRKSYPTMKGRADIYVAFFEAALRQLKEGGVCSYICADRWMFNQYGAELRRLVTGGFAVETIVEMHDADAFDDDVSAYPAVTVIRRGVQGRTVVASAGPEAGSAIIGSLTKTLRCAAGENASATTAGLSTTVVESWFQGSSPWPCNSPARLALLRRLEEEFGPLESDATATKVGIGVATGLDDVYITKDASLVEGSRLLPLAMAIDTASGQFRWSGHYLVNPWDDGGLVDLEEFPRLKAYFGRHEGAIRRRNTARKNPRGWFRTIDRVNHALIGRPKLYIPDIKDRFNPVLADGGTYPHHNLYFIRSRSWDLEVLGGLLLSSIGRLFIESYGVRMRGGYFRFQAQYLRRIHVPDPRSIAEGRAKELIRAFREGDRERATEVAFELYRVAPSEMNDGD